MAVATFGAGNTPRLGHTARAFGARGQQRKRRIALIGLRGAGKTTLGKRLAARRRVPFIELEPRNREGGGRIAGRAVLLYGLPV
jgi:XRE family aerobic/anaerobic benzoate catabolism transcriptional regulator